MAPDAGLEMGLDRPRAHRAQMHVVYWIRRPKSRETRTSRLGRPRPWLELPKCGNFASKFSFCTGYRDSGIVLAPDRAVDRIKSPSSTPVGTCAHQIDHYH